MSFKREKVVMLQAPFRKDNIPPIKDLVCDGRLSLTGMHGLTTTKYYHLYVYTLLEVEIQKGDYCIVNVKNDSDKHLAKVLEIDGINSIYLVELLNSNKAKISVFKSECKKIIATTDNSIKYPLDPTNVDIALDDFSLKYRILPQPSHSFIGKFIKHHNVEKPITDVMVEYDDIMSKEIFFDGISDFKKKKIGEKLKINTKDNTITIKKVKDTWNREEVTELLFDALTSDGPGAYNMGWSAEEANKWIEEKID